MDGTELTKANFIEDGKRLSALCALDAYFEQIAAGTAKCSRPEIVDEFYVIEDPETMASRLEAWDRDGVIDLADGIGEENAEIVKDKYAFDDAPRYDAAP